MVVRPFVYALVVLFGSSSWLSTNSIWMELSLLTQALPEGWALPSYLAAVIQVACIGPMIYTILHKCTRMSVPQAPAILSLLIICSLSTLAMAWTWSWTGQWFGAERSLALIGITFVMALVNATSNVLFMPYMALFHPSYLTAYFVGMGFSALVPSVVSIAQGTMNYECVPPEAGGSVSYPRYLPARFGVTAYNNVMFAWMCLATVSFAVLHWFVLNEHKEASKRDGKSTTEDGTTTLDELAPLKDPSSKTAPADIGHPLRYATLIVCLALACAEMNSILPSVQSFASLPYSMTAYHLTLTVANLFHPLTPFLLLWLKPRTIGPLAGLSTVAAVMTAFVVHLALASPTLLLQDSPPWGAAISVAVSVAASSLCSYLRTVLTAVIREDSPHNESRLFWCGVTMQIGSFIGAVVMFPLVNVFDVFRPAKMC